LWCFLGDYKYNPEPPGGELRIQNFCIFIIKDWYYLLSFFEFILNIIMFLFFMFLDYSSSTFDMVMIDNELMYMFAKRLALFVEGLGDRCHVSMVLRCNLSAITPYWPGSIVDHGSDSSV